MTTEASKRHLSRLIEIQSTLSGILGELEKRAAKTDVDWRDVGDVAEIHAQLLSVLAFARGGER